MANSKNEDTENYKAMKTSAEGNGLGLRACSGITLDIGTRRLYRGRRGTVPFILNP